MLLALSVDGAYQRVCDVERYDVFANEDNKQAPRDFLQTSLPIRRFGCCVVGTHVPHVVDTSNQAEVCKYKMRIR